MADFLGLMKQATELKSKMEAMQAELDQVEVEGTSGGGLVTVKLSGKGEMKGVTIDDTLMQPSEKEIVADLIVAADGVFSVITPHREAASFSWCALLSFGTVIDDGEIDRAGTFPEYAAFSSCRPITIAAHVGDPGACCVADDQAIVSHADADEVGHH